MNEYQAVVRMLTPVLGRGRAFDPHSVPDATPLAREIAYGVLRDWFRLDAITRQLLKKPLAERHTDVRILLLAGLYSVDAIRRPAHASVNAVVDAASELGKSWATGLVNGVLRNYLRNRQTIVDAISETPAVKTGHPGWMARAIRRDWPNDVGEVLAANNEQAPMTLRVNLSRISRAEYLGQLTAAGLEGQAGAFAESAIYLLAPAGVDKLPGFADGLVSVQDEASQLAAQVVSPRPGEQLLDACAAPGGKTCHLLEAALDLAPGMTLTAVDVDSARLQQLSDNVARLSLECSVEVADLLDWHPPGRTFDRILIDAPCSATGVIRRHPDIKLLRRKSDIAKLAAQQLALLRAAWQLLKGGGVLVYSTCSVLMAENDGVIGEFVNGSVDAQIDAIDADWGYETRYGRQLLPTSKAHDGFYFARLMKHPS